MDKAISLAPDVERYTSEIKALVGRTAQNIVLIGEKLQAVKEQLQHGQWEVWLRTEFAWSDQSARRMMQVAERFKSNNLLDLRVDVSALYILAAPSTPPAAAEEAMSLAQQGEAISPTRAKALVNKHRGVQTLSARRQEAPIGAPEQMGQQGSSIVRGEPSPRESSPTLHLIPDPPPGVNGQRSTFNKTNEMVDWAKWTWNPVTGCLHTCGYCYARDIAERFYPEKFTPTFHPERLAAPHYTKVPPEADDQVGYRNVFVCSMADLFGKWVPQEWIDAVLAEVRAAPQWNFLFLTKFPQRLADITWPENAWVGTTVDEQYRVEIAERAFRKVDAPVKWLSCEPLRQRLTFTSLAMFDWVVLGGQSKSTQEPAFQPPWEWVWHLCTQAEAAGCLLYWKPNLETRPQQWPGSTRLVPPLAVG
jgi:protein gp37